MKEKNSINLSRENHLDHLVRVVPFIVVGYGIQSYVILSMNPGTFSQISLSVLGGFLALMIAGFITYDLKHQVTFEEDRLRISFLTLKKTILYSEIQEIRVLEPKETFTNLFIKSSVGNHTFYFVDDAEKVKAWILTHSGVLSDAA